MIAIKEMQNVPFTVKETEVKYPQMWLTSLQISVFLIYKSTFRLFIDNSFLSNPKYSESLWKSWGWHFMATYQGKYHSHDNWNKDEIEGGDL